MISMPWLYKGIYDINLAILNKVKYHNIRDERGRFAKEVKCIYYQYEMPPEIISKKWKLVLLKIKLLVEKCQK